MVSGSTVGRKKPRIFSHLDSAGNVRMVDVSAKKSTLRFAKASALISLSHSTLQALLNPPQPSFIKGGRGWIGGKREIFLKKGDAFTTAKIAGILAAKRVHELIPLTHPVPLTHCDISFETTPIHADTSLNANTCRNLRASAYAVHPRESAQLKIVATVKTKAETGVEMEALTAVTVAALTIYDMVKSVERGAVIEKIQLEEKWGGKSGHFRRSDKVVR